MNKITVKIVIEVAGQTEDEDFYICEDCGGCTTEPVARALEDFYTAMGVLRVYVELCDCD